MRRAVLMSLALWYLPLAGCQDSPTPSASSTIVTAAPAGRVLEVAGVVTVAGKPLAKGDTVTADTIIDTAADGSVVIELAHNLVHLELGPNKHVKVNESLAWTQPKRSEPTTVVDQATASGGRPVERSAAGTVATTETAAPRETAGSAQAVEAPKETVRQDKDKDKDKDKEKARQEAVTAGVLGQQRDGGGGSLGVSGTGPGGGGVGTTGGLGDIGTIGRGGGTGNGVGYGKGDGSIGAKTESSSSSVSTGEAQVQGSLDKSLVQRVIKGNMSRFRYCYETGLKHNPKLAGKAVVKFAIDKSGAVISAVDQGSTLADTEVVACIVKAFRMLSFPKPADVVTVVYPLIFKGTE